MNDVVAETQALQRWLFDEASPCGGMSEPIGGAAAFTSRSALGTRESRPHDNRKGSNLAGEHGSSTAWWNEVPRGTMDEVR